MLSFTMTSQPAAVIEKIHVTIHIPLHYSRSQWSAAMYVVHTCTVLLLYCIFALGDLEAYFRLEGETTHECFISLQQQR